MEESIRTGEIEKELALLDIRSKAQIQQLLTKKWPEVLYTHVGIREGNPLMEGQYMDQAIVLLSSELKMENGIHKQYIEKYPLIKEIVEDNNKPSTVSEILIARREGKRIVFKIAANDSDDHNSP